MVSPDRCNSNSCSANNGYRSNNDDNDVNDDNDDNANIL